MTLKADIFSLGKLCATLTAYVPVLVPVPVQDGVHAPLLLDAVPVIVVCGATFGVLLASKPTTVSPILRVP